MLEYVKRKERMPVAFVVGSHPADGVAATAMSRVDDEVALMGGLRGAPVPLVRCATIDAMVPADAEIVLEGYLDEHGWIESEGPFGEYVGYYGRMKTNPVFHLTAITMRRDARIPDRDDWRPLAGLYRYGAALRAAYRSGRMGRVPHGAFASRSRSTRRHRAAACTICACRCGSAIPARCATPFPPCSARMRT